MTKAICYSLFGYGQKYDNCFSFDSYLSGLMLSLRFNKLLYPGWQNILQVDKKTHETYEYLFSSLEKIEVLKVEINSEAPLCKAMLWRLKSLFWGKADESEFTHVICRDLDSLSTFREVQAVQTWINHDKAAHAITDSVSHTIPMLGGMIGFRSSEFKQRTGINSFENLMALNTFDMSKKGADQKFLNQIVYPHFSEMGSDSITQHYFKGHANTWLSDFHTCDCWLYNATVGHKDDCKENTVVELPDELRETNEISEHIGAAGFNQLQTMKLIKKYEKMFLEFLDIEQHWPDIFYWVKR